MQCQMPCYVMFCLGIILPLIWYTWYTGDDHSHETGSLVPKQPVWRDVRGFWTLLIWWGHDISHNFNCIQLPKWVYHTSPFGWDMTYCIPSMDIPYQEVYIYTGDISFTETITNLAVCNEGRNDDCIQYTDDVI